MLQVAPTLVPLLKFYFHEEVRKAAVSGSNDDNYCCYFSFLNMVRVFIKFLDKYVLSLNSYARAAPFSKISCGERASSRS